MSHRNKIEWVNEWGPWDREYFESGAIPRLYLPASNGSTVNFETEGPWLARFPVTSIPLSDRIALVMTATRLLVGNKRFNRVRVKLRDSVHFYEKFCHLELSIKLLANSFPWEKEFTSHDLLVDTKPPDALQNGKTIKYLIAKL